MNKSICRLCYENPGIVSIYDTSKGTQTSAKIIYCCVNIKIAENDGLPTHICMSCEKELSTCYEFILQCEAADRKIRAYQCHNISADMDTKVEIKMEFDHCFPDDPSLNDNSYESPSYIKQEADENLPTVKRKVRSYKKRKSRESIVSKVYKCNVCGRRCANPSTLQIHMRCHTNERPYVCATCNKAYKDGGSLKRHTERNHFEKERSRNYMCENCGKGFFSKNEVKIHMRTHTGETPYACVYCPARFGQINSLQRHTLRHTGVRTHQCSMCVKKFCTKNELQKHYTAHSNVKNYQCSICSTLFKYKNSLNKHLQNHMEANKFICNDCGRHFNTKGCLKLHIERIHSVKSGFCGVCVKNVPNLEEHMWKHTGEKPFKCEYCANSYSLHKGLMHHINFRHKNPDKFKCTIDGCAAKFPSRPMLQFHVAKLHETGKPINCNKCSRGFYRKSDLARHMKGTHKQLLLD